jgi:hypothetical protein
MKKAAIFVLAAILVAVCVPVFAQQFPDVPQDHWAYAAVQDLASKGIIQGYPDGTFGGKRALTRYEFAQAIEKAIPVIAGMVKGGEGVPGPAGPQGPQGEPGVGVSKDVIDNLQKLVGEFNDELSALNVDVQGLKRDLAALSQRVAAVEAEQARVKITGEADMIARGLVSTGTNSGFDLDGRHLGNQSNPLSNNSVFENYELGIKGKVNNNTSVTAVIIAGDYLNYALGNGGTTGVVANGGLNDFTLWNMYVDTSVKAGFLGNAQIVAGRMPFQLTPLTMKMVPADSYNYVAAVDNGDYVVDGGRITFNISKVNLTAFAAKSGVIGNGNNSESLGLLNKEALGGDAADGNVSVLNQFAGARAVVSTPFNGNLGLTYVQFAANTSDGAGAGQLQVFGADFKGSFSKVSLDAEYSNSRPNDMMNSTLLDGEQQSRNGALNAKLGYQVGNLQVGAGYSQIQQNFIAPGYWSKIGQAVNLTGVEGPAVNLTYAITPRVSFCANGEELKPVSADTEVLGRTSVDGIGAVDTDALNKVDHWTAGIKYAVTASNSIDLGYEEAQWKPQDGLGLSTSKERYLTVGLGHTFSQNASLKLLYQVVEFTGDYTPYTNIADINTRGGVAGAQFQLKY